MHKLAAAGALIVALVCNVSLAHGQRATERFIPLGQSPGVSGTLTTIGTIMAVDAQAHRITLSGPGGSVNVSIRDSTEIWIDRHELGLSTLAGSFTDCRAGSKAEVKYLDPQTREVAEWVKLEAPRP